jgi:hypothetical protein
MQTAEPTDPIGQIHTVNTLASSEPALNEGGIRFDIFQHKQELIEDGSIFYAGNKLFIDRDRYIRNLKSRNK